MFRPPAPASMTLNLAPMVDVLMCLIVFFLLASKLVSAEHYPVNLPWAVAAREVPSQELGDRVTINVRPAADGRADRVEYVVSDWDGQQIIERLLVPEDIEALLRARAGRAGRGEELRCVVRAARDVQFQHVEMVLRACGRARIAKIVFAANKGEAPARPDGGEE